MKLSFLPSPYVDALIVVSISGPGGSGSYRLSQLAMLDQEYRIACYGQRGTGNNLDTPVEDYSVAQIATELHQALVTAGVEYCAVIGHVFDALAGMQLMLGCPTSVTVLVNVNGQLRINARTRRYFQAREQLLHSGGAQAWVEAQPLFLYPADWMATRAPRLEAESVLALAHSQGKNNLPCQPNVLKRADFSHHAGRIRCPVQIICTSDDLLVLSVCSSELHAAPPNSQKTVMCYGGHTCNVTDPETFDALLLSGSASLLHHHEAVL